jgi:hypothetical protein
VRAEVGDIVHTNHGPAWVVERQHNLVKCIPPDWALDPVKGKWGMWFIDTFVEVLWRGGCPAEVGFPDKGPDPVSPNV